ncbi:hypothetical protein SALBM217S_02505 [Streptomyces griseoloalbus]
METSTEGATRPDTGPAVPAEAVDTVVVAPPAAAPPASLSPSRASDFMQCPLLYRFRVIDRLPEKPSEAATRARWCTRCSSGCSTPRPATAPCRARSR